MNTNLIDVIILLLFASCLTVLIMFFLTYDELGYYKDAVITFITIFSFVLFIYDRLKKSHNKNE